MIEEHALKKIGKIRFSLYSPEMIRKVSAARIFVPDTYDDDGYPIEGGLIDLRLGVADPGLRCKTCGGRVKECSGHFGHIELVRPVVHVGFAKYIYYALRRICSGCYKVLDKEIDTKKGVKCSNCGKENDPIKFVKPTSFTQGGEQLLPSEIRDRLSRLSDSDIRKLGFDPIYSRPEWMILTVLLVPPVSVRPSITLESGERSEDDLTHKLVEVIRVNQKLEANINAGAPQLIIEDLWELLQYHVTTFFDNETANIPPAKHRSGRPLKTLSQRLKGKEGRFRYNLSGKRVNFSARTVISPDPRIHFYEVGVPEQIASELTVPLHVNEWNLELCKEIVRKNNNPKVNYIIRPDGRKIRVTPESDLELLAENLKPGYILERQAVDGDIVLFNRQPSLHRISMMGHRMRILPGRTFRLNPVVTPPYNADFDGDEMNLHMIQKEEAQTEAIFLTRVEGQILSPRHGNAIIKPLEDLITGLYYITRDDAKYDRNFAHNLLYLLGVEPESTKEEYTGKELFSMILPKELSFTCEGRAGNKVVIRKGKLLKGELDSKTIGKLISHMFIKYGVDTTKEFIDRSCLMSLEILSSLGFSVSLKNYTLSEEAEKKIRELNSNLERKIDSLIMQYKNKTLERLPGLTLKETLERTIMSLTGETRNAIGKIVEADLGQENMTIVMARIGSRGSLLNAIQMSAVVAQQAVRNKRPERGYKGRTLLMFKKGNLGAKARGYVESSFRKGLTPPEFFLHAMGGRESIVNTAIRTGRSGYMQRRLINALQDLVVDEKLSVRDSGLNVIQFTYGGDGKDPMFSSDVEVLDSDRKDDVDTA